MIFRTSTLRYAKDNLFTFNHAPFLSDQRFLEAYSKGIATDKGRFLKGVNLEWRIHVLIWAARKAMHLPGDFVECGVRTGVFSTAIIDYLKFQESDKFFYLIDSFQGIPSETMSDYEFERERNGIKEDKIWRDILKEVNSRWKDTANVKVIKGVIPEVLAHTSFNKLAFISMDLNSAKAEAAALDKLWCSLVPGGVIVLDDYGYPGFEEQQRVHDEFAMKMGTSVLCLPTCQGLIIKPT